jgi:hypothetical protein
VGRRHPLLVLLADDLAEASQPLVGEFTRSGVLVAAGGEGSWMKRIAAAIPPALEWDRSLYGEVRLAG